MLSAPQASWPLAPWPKVCVDSFVEISQLRRLELVGLSRLGTVAVGHAAPLERAIRAQQELGLLQPNVGLFVILDASQLPLYPGSISD